MVEKTSKTNMSSYGLSQSIYRTTRIWNYNYDHWWLGE